MKVGVEVEAEVEVEVVEREVQQRKTLSATNANR
jgi:hypothetical protein